MRIVITSYSIHYTKLYESFKASKYSFVSLIITGLNPISAIRLGIAISPFVITSYSIHYTKLYDSAVENAYILKGIFSGEIRDAKRDILVLNGAAALYVGKKVGSIRDGVAMANEILDSGKVMDKLNEYIKYTNELEAI